jgi:hypothetical protein
VTDFHIKKGLFFHLIFAGSLLLTLTACEKMVDYTSSGAFTAANDDEEEAEASAPASTVSLNAFRDFQCTGNWTNRDGGLGLRAGSGSGSCSSTFSGNPGNYNIQVRIQTEFDGQSPFRVSVNGRPVYEGRYPLSTGQLMCDCPDWRQNCPDKYVTVDAGSLELQPGDVIEFYGAEDYPCGSHGSYAKWHGMNLVP